MGGDMVIWGLKNCDACRKAKTALGAVEIRDVRDNPLTEKEIADLLAVFGDAAVNRKSTTWRGLSEPERAREPAALLSEYPALMKRPVIEKDGQLYLGWGEETRKALL